MIRGNLLIATLTGVGLLSALPAKRHPWVPAATAFVLWAAVPFSALAGGSAVAGLHPAAFAVIGGAVVLMITRTRVITRELAAAPLVATACILLAVVTTVMTAVGQQNAVGNVANMVVVPLVAFGLVRHALRDPEAGGRFRSAILIIAAFEAVIAIGVRLGLVAQPWQTSLAARHAFYDDTFTRAFGTTDHPLVLVLIFVLATPLLLGVPNVPLRMALGALGLTAALLTESRSGIVLVSIALAAVVLRTSASIWVRLLTALIGAGMTAAIVVSPWAATVLAKFADDGGSAGARSLGLEWTLANLDRFLISGAGAGASFEVTSSLPTSLESPLFMFIPDFGLLITVLYFGVAGAVLRRRQDGSTRVVPGGVLAAVATLMHVVTFSSLAAYNSSAGMLWITLGLAGAIAAPGGDMDGVPTGREAHGRAEAPLRARAAVAA